MEFLGAKKVSSIHAICFSLDRDLFQGIVEWSAANVGHGI
jgi:hypothetical protein